MQEQPGKTCPDKSANNTTEPLQAHNHTDGETDVPEVEFECSGNALDQDNGNHQSQGKPVHKKTNISKGQHLYHSILAEAKHIAAFASRDYAMGEKVLAYLKSFKMELFQGNIPSLGCVQQGKLTPANLFTPVTADCASSLTVGSRVKNPGPSVKHRFKRSGELIKKSGRKSTKGKNTNAVVVQTRTCYICHDPKSCCPKFNCLSKFGAILKPDKYPWLRNCNIPLPSFIPPQDVTDGALNPA